MSFSSPYRFIPLPSKVIFPEWQAIEHDQPDCKGFCGEITLSIQNLSPLIIGDEASEKAVQPFFKVEQNGQRLPAIPGTSMKGMLRSIIELATCSGLQIEDSQFAQRDLTSAKNEYMTTMRGKKSGWLKWNEVHNQWYIFPCTERYKTIRHTESVSHNGKNANTDVSEVLTDFFEQPLHSIEHAKARYEMIASAKPKAKRVGANIEIISGYYLVVTNQLEGSTKRREFLFTEPKTKGETKGKVVSDEVFCRFQKVMDDSQTEVGAEHWHYLKAFAKEGIPVFYLENTAREITSFGLASLYRLPYEKSIDDLLPEAQKKSTINTQYDFTELLFGTTVDPKHPLKSRKKSRKGRINIALATTEQPATFKSVSLALASPKPSFYPAYLRQGVGEVKTYNTAQTIAGAKVYLPKKSVQSSPEATNSQGEALENMLSHVEALVSNTQFKTKIRVHNILPEEIGALIWAIEFGEKVPSNYVHLLGMGKPYGYGKVAIKIEDLSLQPNAPTEQRYDKEYFLEQFYRFLGAHDILQSDTLAALKVAHKEGVIPDQELGYLSLDMAKKVNEFAAVIKAKKVLDPLPIADEKQKLEALQQTLASKIEQTKQHYRAQAVQQERIKQAEQEREIQAQKAQEDQERLARRSALEVLLQDHLKGEITKQSLTLLIENPNLYQNLSEAEQEELKNKIEVNPWFKSLKKKRSNWRKKLPDLLL